MFSNCDPKTAGAGGHAPVRRATVGSIHREYLDRTLVLGRHHLEVVFAGVGRALQLAPSPQPARTVKSDSTPALIGDVDAPQLRGTDGLRRLIHE
jgi:hypothetical protein